jgi:hypothetical protein
MEILRPQDVVVVLKLIASERDDWTYAELGQELGMSASQVFLSVTRAATSHLLQHPAVSMPKLNRGNLKEFLVHGVKYSFPAEHRGVVTRGIPTSYAAPPLNQFVDQSWEPPPVWPHPEGKVRGSELSPLYKNVPAASMRDPKLYELLALVDAIRDGRAREREIAIRELIARIDSK